MQLKVISIDDMKQIPRDPQIRLCLSTEEKNYIKFLKNKLISRLGDVQSGSPKILMKRSEIKSVLNISRSYLLTTVVA